MLVSRQIPALFNGVSQQPAPVRSSSQCEEQFNCVSSVADGVRKRGPSVHLARLTTSRLGTALLHQINRDVTERYNVIVTATGIRVFDMAGVEKTVTAPLGWGYLSVPAGVTSRGAYVCTTVADYTFVLNKTKKVTMLAVGADLDPPSGTYWWLNRPIDGAAAMALPIDDFEGGGGGTTPSTSAPATGARGSNPVGTYVGAVQTLQDLPTTATVGQVYQVIGTNESGFQSYYVIKQAGGWYETVKPGLKNLVDANTMPHALIRQGDGTFTFGPFAWEPRKVGDYTTNPNPTFVGRTIRDIFFHRNRLGFATDENAILSRTGQFGNFYRLTVVDFLPDEVVDVAASETKVTKIEYAVPFQGSLMLFSDQVQFKLTHNDVFAAGAVSLDVTTQYPMIPGVRPQASGADVYFASDGSGWGLLREYFVNNEGITNDASDVTAHVQRYIPYGIHALAAAPEYDSVFVLTDGAPNRIYAYKYYWQTESEKAQSAWNYWEFASDATVLSAKPMGGYLYLLIDRTDGTHLERIPLFYGSLVAGLDFQVYLDRRVAVTGAYNATTNLTTFTLPYELPLVNRGAFRCVRGSAFTTAKGAALSPTWTSLTTFTVPGNYSAGPCACGLVYTARYVFSKPYIQNGNGEAVQTGRLQMKTWSVGYTDTGYFRAEVKPYGPNGTTTFTREFPTRNVGIVGLGAVGAPVFSSGKATFAVQANAHEAEVALVSDSYLGFCFHSAEWEGFFHKRAHS